MIISGDGVLVLMWEDVERVVRRLRRGRLSWRPIQGVVKRSLHSGGGVSGLWLEERSMED